MPATKQQLVQFIESADPQATKLLGAEKLNAWAAGTLISKTYDDWLKLFSTEGGDNHMLNIINAYVNIASVGYDDFSTKKKKMGDLYRAYVAMALAVVAHSQEELVQLQNEERASSDPVAAMLLEGQIQVQESTIAAQQKNAQTWQKTLADALASHQIE